MKTVQCRVVDLDAGTVAALRAYRAVRGLVALDLVDDAALVLGDLDSTHRHPDRFSPESSRTSSRHARRWGRSCCR